VNLGHPKSYKGFGSKLCPACLDNGRGHVALQPFFMRAVNEDKASLVYACPRCQHQEVMSTHIALDALTAPAVEVTY